MPSPDSRKLIYTAAASWDELEHIDKNATMMLATNRNYRETNLHCLAPTGFHIAQNHSRPRLTLHQPWFFSANQQMRPTWSLVRDATSTSASSSSFSPMASFKLCDMDKRSWMNKLGTHITIFKARVSPTAAGGGGGGGALFKRSYFAHIDRHRATFELLFFITFHLQKSM